MSPLRYGSVASGVPFAFTEESRRQIADALTRYPTKQAALLPVLWIAQTQAGWISKEAAEEVARTLGLSAAYVDGVLTFYTMYHLSPQGRHHLQFCTSISCHLNGGEELLSFCEKRLGIRRGERTPDGGFSIEEVECIAGCDRAPSMQVNDKYYEPMTPEKLEVLLAKLAAGSSSDASASGKQG